MKGVCGFACSEVTNVEITRHQVFCWENSSILVTGHALRYQTHAQKQILTLFIDLRTNSQIGVHIHTLTRAAPN